MSMTSSITSLYWNVAFILSLSSIGRRIKFINPIPVSMSTSISSMEKQKLISTMTSKL